MATVGRCEAPGPGPFALSRSSFFPRFPSLASDAPGPIFSPFARSCSAFSLARSSDSAPPVLFLGMSIARILARQPELLFVSHIFSHLKGKSDLTYST